MGADRYVVDASLLVAARRFVGAVGELEAILSAPAIGADDVRRWIAAASRACAAVAAAEVAVCLAATARLPELEAFAHREVARD